MKKTIMFLIITLLFMFPLFTDKVNISNKKINLTASNIENSSYVPSEYNYVWGDEFNSNTLDTKKWTNSSDSPKVDKSVYVSDGSLNLIKYANGGSVRVATHNEKATNPDSPNIKAAIQYGYIEAKIKTPMDNGAWPAFWIKTTTNLPDRKEKNWFAEVDIMEACGNTCGTGYTNATYHKWQEYSNWHGSGTYFHQQTSGISPKVFKPNPNEWHIYALLWTPEKMTIYYDGQIVSELGIRDEDDFSPNVDDMYKGMQGFREPAYFILSQGGTSYADTSAMPFHEQVDYVRVYQKSGEGNVYTSPYLTTDSLPDGNVDSNYNEKIESSGMPKDYNKFNLIKGKLPDGLALNEDGTISGIPTKTGTYAFTIQTLNEKIPNQTDSKEYTINISEKSIPQDQNNSDSQNNESSEVVSVPSTSLYGSIMIIILGIICIIVSIVVTRKLTRSNSK